MWDYKKLDVWKRAIDLIPVVYELTKKFPKEELYGLVSQMRRAFVSVSANIAEGCGRRTVKDYVSFLYNALGSVKEVESELYVCEKLGYISGNKLDDLLKELDEIGKMIVGVISYVSSKNIE
ncbi:MAG: four helix bundle protein [archaeon]